MDFSPGLDFTSKECLKLPDNVEIVIVHDACDALQMAQAAAVLGMNHDGECSAPALAFDVEWPCAAWDAGGRASIMQVSNHRTHSIQYHRNVIQVGSSLGCVIFDLNAICSNSGSTNAFNDLMTRIMVSSAAKLFYGCDQDMHKLRSSWPEVEAFGIKARRCLELNLLAAAVHADLRNKSLNDVCLMFLGQPLNKQQRLSNWALRPLTFEQVSYAALDVYAPILIFESLRSGRHGSKACAAAAAGGEWFESFCFDLSAANILPLDRGIVPDASNVSQSPLHAAALLSTSADVVDAAHALMTNGSHVDGYDRAEVPLESAAAKLSDTSIDIISASEAQETSHLHICLGTCEVVAALEKCKRVELEYELTNVRVDASDSGSGSASKFEVFDRIQMHADMVGMTRQQVTRVRVILID